MTKITNKKSDEFKPDMIDNLGVDIFRKMLMDLNITDAINSCSTSKNIGSLCTENFWKQYLETNYSIKYKPQKYTWTRLAKELGVYLGTNELFGKSKTDLLDMIITHTTNILENERFDELDILALDGEEGVIEESDDGFTIKYEYIFYLFYLGLIAISYRVTEDDILLNKENKLKLKTFRIVKTNYGLNITEVMLPPEIKGMMVKDSEGELEDSLIEVLGNIYNHYPFTLGVGVIKEGKSYAEMKD